MAVQLALRRSGVRVSSRSVGLALGTLAVQIAKAFDVEVTCVRGTPVQHGKVVGGE